MKRSRIKTAVLLLLFLIFFTGCGNRGQEQNQDPHVTINVWTKDKHDLDFWQEKIKEYNRTNEDNITVVYQVYSNNYAQVVSNALESDSAPDIMAYTGEIYDWYAGQKKFQDILPMMDQNMLDSFRTVMTEGINLENGKCYFLPTGISAIRLIYNQDLFDQVGIEGPPETLEEMIEDARRITGQLSEDGIYGFAVNLKEPKAGLSRSFMAEALLETGIKNGYDFGRGCYDFSKYRDLIEEWRSLLAQDCAYPGCADLSIDPLREMFSEGKIGMYFTYGFSETGVYKEQFPTEINWEIARIPIREEAEGWSDGYSYTGGYLFNSGSSHLEEAWKVYKAIFANMENLTEHYINGFSVSALPEVLAYAQEQGYQADEALIFGDRDRVWPKAPHDQEPKYVHIEGNDLFETIKETIYSNGDITYALAGLTERYNKGYREAVKNGVCKEMKITGFDPAEPSLVFDVPDEK